ncbi:MAG: hypothetical protein HQL94_03945, partial [Magnetococcales bacterium]|nr:hypothetical protein [Magnetococcales bacterium]
MNDNTENFLVTIFRLDANDDVSALLEFIQSQYHDPDQMLFAIYLLLSRTRIKSAFILTMVLANQG